jgi:tetratricopeptide (TPR) repeat protein
VILYALAACGGERRVQEQSVLAAPSAPPPVVVEMAAPAPAKGYHRALERGRQAARRGDQPAAIAAFEEALAARPEDARALGELGWAAFKLGELLRAEDATRRSIARAADPRLRAASLYNLGRILEDRRLPDEARAAYEESLRLRPNGTVRERLAALGAGADDTAGAPPLAGPYASPAAYCAALNERNPSFPVTCEDPPLARAGGAQVFGVIDEYGDRACALAVADGGGWRVRELGPCARAAIAAGEPLRVSAESPLEADCQLLEVVCAGTSCTPVLAVAAGPRCGEWSERLTVTVAGGLVTVSGKAKASDLANAVGRYRL